MTTDSTIATAQRCPVCGAANDCAIALGAKQCWCMVAPSAEVSPASSGASCYCRDCLRAAARSEEMQRLQKSPRSR